MMWRCRPSWSRTRALGCSTWRSRQTTSSTRCASCGSAPLRAALTSCRAHPTRTMSACAFLQYLELCALYRPKMLCMLLLLNVQVHVPRIAQNRVLACRNLPAKIGDALTAEEYRQVKELGLLVDKDDQARATQQVWHRSWAAAHILHIFLLSQAMMSAPEKQDGMKR